MLKDSVSQVTMEQDLVHILRNLRAKELVFVLRSMSMVYMGMKKADMLAEILDNLEDLTGNPDIYGKQLCIIDYHLRRLH